MKTSEISEELNTNQVEAIKRCVGLEELIRNRYDHIWRQLVPQLGRRTMRLPSPFRSAGDTSKSVVIFSNKESEAQEWYWADPLAPSSIPRNVIGFVMAFDGCSYEEAVECLAKVLKQFQEYRRLDGAHLRMVKPSADDMLRAELDYTRERVAAMGGALSEKFEQFFALLRQ